MDISSVIGIVLTALVSAAGTVAAVYLILTRYFESQQQQREAEWKEKKRKDYLPIRMQAYERLILLLERIHPERLVFRASKPGMSARLLQSEINKIIREEFDHNLTQQLYISSEGWEAVKAAREEVGSILNVSAERVHREADAMEFSRAILEVTSSLERIPSDVAISILKSEFRKTFK